MVWERQVMVQVCRVVQKSLLSRLEPYVTLVRTFMKNEIDDNVDVSEKPLPCLCRPLSSHF